MERRTDKLEIDMGELEEILRRISGAPKDLETLRSAIETLAWLQGEISRKDVSLARLRQLFGMHRTEKTRQVLGDAPETPAKKEEGDDEKGEPPQRDLPAEEVTGPAPKGHGRHAAADYTEAERVEVKHESRPPDLPPWMGMKRPFRQGCGH